MKTATSTVAMAITYIEEVVAGKRQIANLVLPKSSSVGDLDAEQLQVALGIDADLLMSAEISTDDAVADLTTQLDAEPVGVSS